MGKNKKPKIRDNIKVRFIPVPFDKVTKEDINSLNNANQKVFQEQDAELIKKVKESDFREIFAGSFFDGVWWVIIIGTIIFSMSVNASIPEIDATLLGVGLMGFGGIIHLVDSLIVASKYNKEEWVEKRETVKIKIKDNKYGEDY